MANNKQYIPGGAFQIARITFESDLWLYKPAAWYKIWQYILGNVQHTESKKLKRGEGFFNFSELTRTKALGVDVTYGQADKFIRYAKRSNMLTTRPATHGVIILVCNYGFYQDLKNYKVERQVEPSVETNSKSGRNEVENIYNKNDNNDKNAKQAAATSTNKKIAWDKFSPTTLKEKSVIDPDVRENIKQDYLENAVFATKDAVRAFINSYINLHENLEEESRIIPGSRTAQEVITEMESERRIQ